MAAFYSSEVTNQNALPPVRVKVNRLQGRIRYALGFYTAPASSPPQIADTIAYVRLPKGVRVLGHLSKFYFAAGTASSTSNLGDAVTAARHLAATAINAAGSAVPEAANASGATFETSDDTTANGDPTSTNNCDVRGTIAGAAVANSQQLTLHMAFVQD